MQREENRQICYTYATLWYCIMAYVGGTPGVLVWIVCTPFVVTADTLPNNTGDVVFAVLE